MFGQKIIDMRFDVVTLFPDLIKDALDHGITGRAMKENQLTLKTWNPRDFTNNKTGRVDDKPYGGGPGMVMESEPLIKAIKKAKQSSNSSHVVYLSPQGQKFNQKRAEEFLQHRKIILLSGRYEGIDERVIESEVDEICSVGDFVVSGGELPAMLLMDAVMRWLPGVLGHPESAVEDSFTEGLLDCPHYTRPEAYQGQAVPEVLLSGDHGAIAQWRRAQALRRTLDRRPDLLSWESVDPADRILLEKWDLLPADRGRQS